MPDENRDSGIGMNDNDDESSQYDCENLTYVQRLRKRFEHLAKEHDNAFHAECNWWLDDEEDEGQVHQPSVIAINDTIRYNQQSSIQSSTSVRSENSVHTQNSLRSQVSLRTQSSINSIVSEPKNEEAAIIHTNPVIRLSEHYTNDDGDDDVLTVDDNENCNDSFESADESEFLRVHDNENTISSRPVSIVSHQSSKLLNIIQELLQNEENYVRSLRNGIDNYVLALERSGVPRTLRGQKFRIFGNVVGIYDFHRTEFLPQLTECYDDPERIADVFNRFVTRDYFYGYVIYAINRKRSELMCNYHVDYFKKVQNECGDRLGINSFLLQPIQRLPRYQLLLNEIIKDLTKDLDNMKPAIAACCVAEKNIQRLLDTVNESMSINDIRNCYEIDAMCQGKFRKASDFDIYDWELRRRFKGRVFLFERCIIYTEELDREYLEFRGYYESNKLGIIFKEGKSKFKLFSRRPGNHETAFYCDMQTVLEWKDIITGMLMDFAMEGKCHFTIFFLQYYSAILF